MYKNKFLTHSIIMLFSLITLFPFNISAIDSASGSDVTYAQSIYILADDYRTGIPQAQILIKNFRRPQWHVEIAATNGEMILDAVIEITKVDPNVGIIFSGTGVNKITGQEVYFYLESFESFLSIEIKGRDSNDKATTFEGSQSIFHIRGDLDETSALILVTTNSNVSLEDIMSAKWKETTSKKLNHLLKSITKK